MGLQRKKTLTHFSLPAIDKKDGTIYIANHDKLIALNPDGSIKWTLALQTYSVTYGPIYRPAIGKDGTIYLDGREDVDNHYAYAIHPKGWISWKAPLNTRRNGNFTLILRPIITPDQKILFALRDTKLDRNKIISFSADGNLQCSDIIFDHDRPSLMMGRDGTMYIADYTGKYLYAKTIQ